MKKTTFLFFALLTAGITGFASAKAQTATVKLVTARTAGAEMTIAVNNMYSGVTIDWGDGNAVTYEPADDVLHEITGVVRGETVTLSADEALFTTLICQGCDLTGIDLTGARKLTSLYCQDNSLTEIDLRDMNALTDFDCSRNLIENIKYTSRTYPERDLLSIENFAAADNLLSGTFNIRNMTLKFIDLSGNRYSSINTLNNKEIDMLKCDHNNLASLSVSTGRFISTLVCNDNNISKLTLPAEAADIRQLVCDNNAVNTTLPLSGCTSLQDLSCANNEIASIEMPANVVMSSLNVENNKLTLAVLPKPLHKPAYLKFTPQAPIDISQADNVKSADGVPYMDIVTWNDRKNNPLDLSGYTYLAVTEGNAGSKNGIIAWYYLDADGTEHEMKPASGSTVMNDYFNSNGKFTFFSEHPRVFARISVTGGNYKNDNVYVETSVISTGQEAAVGITDATADVGVLTVTPGKGTITIESAESIAVTVYSTDGALLWSGTVGAGTKTIALPAGIYLVNGKKYSVQ